MLNDENTAFVNRWLLNFRRIFQVLFLAAVIALSLFVACVFGPSAATVPY